MIPHAMRVLKMYLLSRLEILKVRTTLGTLCPTMHFSLFGLYEPWGLYGMDKLGETDVM